MGFTISLARGDFGRATHRRDPHEALAVGREFARDVNAEVRIASAFEQYTVEAFAAALAQGRFRSPAPP